MRPPPQKLVALCIAEKPSVAKGIATILSKNNYSRRPNISKYNQVYEFTYAMDDVVYHMIVTSVLGHIK